MKGKELLIVFISLTFISLLSACSDQTPIDKPITPDIKDTLSGKITVWSDGDKLKALEEAGSNFKKLHPKVQINYVEVAENQLGAKLSSAISDNKDIPNVITVPEEEVASTYSQYKDEVVDVTDKVKPIKDKFLNNMIYGSTVDGKIYAFPWNSLPVAVYYRTDILKNNGIQIEDIKTWQDYIEAAQKLKTSSSGKVKMFAINEKNDDNVFREMLNQLGTFYFDKDGKPVLNSEKSIKAMSILKVLKDSNLAVNISDEKSLLAELKDGTIAALPYNMELTELMMKNIPEQKGKWGMVKLPAFEPGGNLSASLGGSSLMILKTGNSENLAIEFSKFAVTDNNSLVDDLTEYGMIPAYTPSYDSPEFDMESSYFNNDKIYSLFSDIAKTTLNSNFTKNYLTINSEVISTQSKILTGGEDVQTAMEELQDNINSTLTK